MMNRLSRAAALTSLLLVAHGINAGDPQNGQTLYHSRCIGCHSIDHNRVGPAHRGVFGRHAGAVPGYAYSDALKSSDVIWTARNLDQWLRSPESLIPGQRMGFSVSNEADRADLIAYLKSLDALETSR